MYRWCIIDYFFYTGGEGVKKRFKKSAVLLTLLFVMSVFSACKADDTDISDKITLPNPVTSKTVVSLSDINLDPPPISVVVPPVTTPAATAPPTTFSQSETSFDPLAFVTAVPLSDYLGITAYEERTGSDSVTESVTDTGVNSDTATTKASDTQTQTTSSLPEDEKFTEKYPARLIFRPYEYSALSSSQKELYALMEDTFMAVQNEMIIPDGLEVTSAEFDTVFGIFLNKEPHDYYVEPTASTRYSKSTDRLYSVTFSYIYPKVTLTSRNERTDTAVRDIVREINRNENLVTDFDKVIWIFDYLVEHVTYDSSSDDSNNIYGALIEGRADCMGYGYAFKELANSLGIEAITVSGQNGSGIPHMWNMVKISNEWYQLDVTFGDPDTGYSNYDYCLTTDTRLLSSYKAATPLKPYPKAVSMEENYYVKNGLFATSETEAIDIMKKSLTSALANRSKCVQILCATANVCANTDEALLTPGSPDNILSTLNALNEAAGNILNVGASAYVYNSVTGVIKIVLAYN
jgi:transglutaminase-like putative cysteine protease